ncbi:tetratricopeptide repeat protein [Pseudolysobacter antarcticus]|uniref:Tetratricopeptide repeat protein n=1 Tax=Pseudolysobacter antarcticus TaxID=2511995 RepID=A0A411HLP8_9GAMM|nr:protein kinase [Pseudolysobacter antarcticus]QBB71423.1 tetratricopeptide repeat protein [Pseudolysobacter antarcticus]
MIGGRMQHEQFAQVKALFTEVCDLVEPARSERLHALTDAPLVIAEVQALLDQTASDPARFAQPVLQALARAAGDELNVGDRLGVWTLVGELGHGGMGSVFRAQRNDGHFEQIAAIKVLRGIPSRAALEHLAQERQILATLAHPNIARLLDGGATPLGQPYLVLEYVEGQPLDQYCRKHKLSIAAIIRLMIGVSDGLSFAHQRLIVHCDLKPGNILVNAEGRPLLLDFGIANYLQGGMTADTQNAVGAEASKAYTPGYASPEQRAGAALSTATDIYGLGRVLQDLLARAPKAAAIDATHLRATATGVDLPDVAALSPRSDIPAALSAIVQRATAEDPAQRYISASAFADDLRRYLDNLPVVAMGANWQYRLRCYLRRNALVLALGMAAVVALLGGLLSTALSLQDVRMQRSRAEVAAARATRTADFLGTVLSAVDPDRAHDLDKTLLHEILDQAAIKAQTELASEPLVLSHIDGVIGNTYYQLGEYDKALKNLQAALLLMPHDSVRERLVLREKIADAHGGNREGEKAIVEYVDIYKERLAAFGTDDRDTLEAEGSMAFQWGENGDYTKAAAQSAALQPRLELLLGRNDPVTLSNLQNLAIARTELHDFPAAEEIFKTLVQRYNDAYGKEHSKSMSVQNSLAILYLRQQRFADAVILLRELYPISKNHFGPNSYKSINFASLLGSALRQQGKLKESEPYYRLALDSARTAYGDDNLITLAYGLNYANFEVASGATTAALQRLQEIEPRLVKVVGADHPDLAELHRTRAFALTALKQNEAARSSWQHALIIDRKVFGSDTHPQVLEDIAKIEALK